MSSQPFFPPLKSVAGALLFTVVLGPVGLLYSSFWGGFFMILVSAVVLANQAVYTLVMMWVISCIWGVGAVERYNRKVLQRGTLHGKE